MKKSTGVLLVLIIILLIGAIGVGGYFWYTGTKSTNDQLGELKNEVAGLKNSNGNHTSEPVTNTTTNNNTTTTTDGQNTSKVVANGKYQFKSQTENYYHEANIELSNQSELSIDFSLNAVHGRDVDNVNIGEVKGKATKIDVPQDCVVPNSTQYAYQFVETQDGNTAKITIVYTAHKTFEYVTVKEEFSNGINPYAGHNVSFAGEYEKVN